MGEIVQEYWVIAVWADGEIVSEMCVSPGLEAVVTDAIGFQGGFSGSSLRVIPDEPRKSCKFFKSGKTSSSSFCDQK